MKKLLLLSGLLAGLTLLLVVLLLSDLGRRQAEQKTTARPTSGPVLADPAAHARRSKPSLQTGRASGPWSGSSPRGRRSPAGSGSSPVS